MKDEPEINFRDLFIPLTNRKVIFWIVIIGIFVFFNSLFNGFVADDNGQIINNPFVHSLTNIPTFFVASTFNLGNGISGIYYKPFLLIVFTIIYSLFGQTAFFFHFFQTMFAIINSVLVFLLIKKFIDKQIAFFIAIIFLVHPINQDTVAYISNTQDVLFFFFGMLSLLFTISKKSKYQELKVFLFLAFSLLSKETGIAFIFVNLIYVYLFDKNRLKSNIFYSFLLLISYLFIHMKVVGTNFIVHHDYHIGRLDLFARLINIPKIVLYYLQTFLFPANLAINYDWVVKNIDFKDFYFPLLIIISLSAIGCFLGNKLFKEKSKLFKAFVLFVAWFVVGMSFHIQIIPLDGTVSTRWFYFPIVGLLGLIGIFIEQFVINKKYKVIVSIIFVLLIFLLSIRTIIRNADFKDNLTLVCHDADVSYDNFSLENSCGVSLLAIGKLDDAQIHLEKSVALAPYYGTNYWGLGAVIGRKAEIKHDKNLYKKSVEDFKTAIKIEPNIPWSYESLGYLYAHYADTKVAKIFLENSLKKFPNDYSLWMNLAYEEYRAGNKEVAQKAINNAYILNPNDATVSEFYSNMTNGTPIKIDNTFF